MINENVSGAQRRGILITIAVIVAVVTLFLSLFFNKMLSPRILSQEELRVNGAIVFDSPRIIKDFTLVDNTHDQFGVENFQGKWTLVYFGFTHCPDICPTTLADVNRVFDSLDDDLRSQLQMVLVTADPARDTPEALNTYVNYFNTEFIGLTGEFPHIMSLAQNLNVAFQKVILDDGNYTIDHTGNLILINPNGDYHAFFKPPFSLSRLKLTLSSILSSY